MKAPSIDTGAAVLLGLAAVAGVWFLTRNAGGLVTGNNAITQAATNAAGQPVTAYQGAGVVGTVGAATNAASGGVLASIGETLGGWAFDLFGPKPAAPAGPATATGQGDSSTQASGWDYTGRLSFAEMAAEDGWWRATMRPLGDIPPGVS